MLLGNGFHALYSSSVLEITSVSLRLKTHILLWNRFPLKTIWWLIWLCHLHGDLVICEVWIIAKLWKHGKCGKCAMVCVAGRYLKSSQQTSCFQVSFHILWTAFKLALHVENTGYTLRLLVVAGIFIHQLMNVNVCMCGRIVRNVLTKNKVCLVHCFPIFFG